MNHHHAAKIFRVHGVQLDESIGFDTMVSNWGSVLHIAPRCRWLWSLSARDIRQESKQWLTPLLQHWKTGIDAIESLQSGRYPTDRSPSEWLALLPPMLRHRWVTAFRRRYPPPAALTWDRIRDITTIVATPDLRLWQQWLAHYQSYLEHLPVPAFSPQAYVVLFDAAEYGLEHILSQQLSVGSLGGQRVRVERVEPPLLLFDGPYDETLTHLVPVRADRPFLRFLAVTEPINAEVTPTFWLDIAQATLFGSPSEWHPLSSFHVCLDSQRLSTEMILYHSARDMREIELSGNGSSATRFERQERWRAAERSLRRLQSGEERVHDTHVIVALAAPDLPALDAMERRLQQFLALNPRRSLKCAVALGQQYPASRLFSSVPEQDIRWNSWLPKPSSFPMLSYDQASFWVPHREYGEQGGIPVLSVNEQLHTIRWFGDSHRPGHALIVGKTGSGKTVAMLTWLHRLAAMTNARVIVLDPQRNAQRLADAWKSEAAHIVYSGRDRVNVLDCVIGDPADMLDQVMFVKHMLSIILGTDTGGGAASLRQWTALEHGILERAIEYTYRHKEERDGIPLLAQVGVHAPTITDLIASLQAMRDGNVLFHHDSSVQHIRDVVTRLIQEFTLRLTEGPYRGLFNGHSEQSLTLDHPVTIIDLYNITTQPWLQALVYTMVLHSINRHVRMQAAESSGAPPVKTIVAIDEYGAMARLVGAPLTRAAANAFKTWRRLGAALWLIDQEAAPFCDTSHDDGQAIWNNAAYRVFFQLEVPEAERVTETVRGLPKAAAQRIASQPVGCCLFIRYIYEGTMMQEITFGRVVLTPSERTFLLPPP